MASLQTSTFAPAETLRADLQLDVRLWLQRPLDAKEIEASVASAAQVLPLWALLTIGGVAMPPVAWAHPEEWAPDWAERLGVGEDDVLDTLARIVSEEAAR